MATYKEEAVYAAERAGRLVDPTCNVCGVDYVSDYSGPCQEPGCRGTVDIWPDSIARAALDAAEPFIREAARKEIEDRLLSDEAVDAFFVAFGNPTDPEEWESREEMAAERQEIRKALRAALATLSPSEDTTEECNCGVEKERSLRHSRFCPLYGVPAEDKEPIDG